MSHTDSALAPPGTQIAPRANLDPLERGISGAAGLLLGTLGVRAGGTTGAVLGLLGSMLVARGVTGACPAKRMLGERPDETDVARAEGWSSAALISRAVTINAARPVVYRRFRDIGSWGEWAVNVAANDVSHANGQTGGAANGRLKFTMMGVSGPISWIGDVVEERADELLVIASAPGADVPVTMRYEFRDAPGGRGTEIHAIVAYEPPGSSLGRYAAKLTSREPGIQVRRDLKRFKSLIEAGEVAVNDPQGTRPKA